MNSKLQQILFRLVLLLLFLPIFQNFFEFSKSLPLSGFFEPASNPTWTLESWMTTNYQQEKDPYLQQNFGFATDMVRLRNSWMFSLYGESNNDQITVGKDQHIFESLYVRDYLGQDSINKEQLDQRIQMLREIQQAFQQMGKAFIFAIAPSKAYYYQDHIPNRYVKTDSSCYEYCLKALKEQQIDFFDVNGWFMSIKDSAQYPLFPQTGTHWSIYGLSVFGDSLLRKMDVVLNKDVPEIIWDSIKTSPTPIPIDRDIETLLNLGFHISTYTNAYPQLNYTQKQKYKPSVLCIGDSFYEVFYCTDIPTSTFSYSGYWRYNSKVYPEKIPRKDSDIELVKDLDVVLLLSTTSNLKDLGWGLIEELHQYLFVPKTQRVQKKLKTLQEKIRNNADWLASIQQKAQQRQISVDSMLYIDALYMVQQEEKKALEHLQKHAL